MAATDHETLALRLADILRLLLGGERPTRLELAERFGVSERTIYRDLNRLGDVVEPGAHGVYQLASAYRGSLSPPTCRPSPASAVSSSCSRPAIAAPGWTCSSRVRPAFSYAMAISPPNDPKTGISANWAGPSGSTAAAN
ncbi:helix-turn-helix transcriptional regulator [Pseudomonas bharatica]|uniref:helix-turn-helix transcriptional regulator n=1 Tax=Pseudomonas bharatica TaxID=2692112 RepID=UPI001F04ED2B|nr:HTH domain-containing protein [Pseudomonas bharatica]